MTGARFHEGVWEGKCDTCLEWMPLDMEHWYPRNGLKHCRFCLSAAHAARQRAKRMTDSAYREGCNEAQQAKRRANRESFLEYQRGWYRANRDAILPKRRAEYAAKMEIRGELDAQRAKNREWMRQWRAHRRGVETVRALGTEVVGNPIEMRSGPSDDGRAGKHNHIPEDPSMTLHHQAVR